MAPLFEGARFIGRDWSGLVQSQGASSNHSSNGTTASAADLVVDHSNASTWIAPFSFQTSNYAHSNGNEMLIQFAFLIIPSTLSNILITPSTHTHFYSLFYHQVGWL